MDFEPFITLHEPAAVDAARVGSLGGSVADART
jgi:hypothetical protein